MIPSRLQGRALPPLRHSTLNEALAAAAQSDVGLTIWNAAEEETTITWHEVYRRARRIAAGLMRAGIHPADRVALILPTSLAFPDAFFGALLAGAVPVPLYPPLRLGRLAEYHQRTARLIIACGARLVLSDRRIRRLLGEATAIARPPLGCRLVEELDGDDELEWQARPEDLALIQFSSGTTFDPRAVALTHANVLANLAAIDSYLRRGDACVAPTSVAPAGGVQHSGVSWLPLYHDMGLIGCLLLAMAHPGPLTLIPPELFLARPSIWLRAIAKKRATVSPAPNFAFGLALRRIRDEDLEGLDLSSWQLALNGAEPINAPLLRRFAARFAPFGFDARALLPVYGLSEAALAVTFSPPGEAFSTVLRDGREVVSVGTPVPGAAVEIRGEDGAVLPLGRTGRVFVRGPSVMQGYYDRPDATAAAVQGGWLDTGDLGFIEGGALHISGRARDIIVLRGANHAPQTFEECLDGVDGVRAGCAVAVGFLPKDGEGEELAILVEKSGDSVGLDARVRAAVLAATGIRPWAVVELEPGTLPRTSSGKLRRFEARRQWLEGELAPPEEVTPLQLAGALVRSQLAFARGRLRIGQDERSLLERKPSPEGS